MTRIRVAHDQANLWFDGASRGNPGEAGAGAFLHDAGGFSLWEGYRYLGFQQTNNQAEYEGLIMGLKAALDGSYTKLVVNGDSQLIIEQMQGIKNCYSPNLLVRQHQHHMDSCTTSTSHRRCSVRHAILRSSLLTLNGFTSLEG
jgi:ribonuclease HI